MHRDNTVRGASPSGRSRDRKIILMRIGLLSVPLSLFTVLIVTALIPDSSFQSPSLLFILNTVFISCVCLVLAVVAARSFLRLGRPSLLLAGCGVLMFAIGGLESGLASGWPDGANDSEGIFGSALFIGSLFLIVGAGLAAGQAHMKRPHTARVFHAAIPYLAVLVLALALAVAMRNDLLPIFFVQGTGPTLLRQAMLVFSVVFFGGSAFVFYDFYLRSHSGLAYWYALGLALIAVGLFGDSLIPSVWSAAYWLGHAVQYLGGIYLLIAVLRVREGKDGQIQWEEALTALAVRTNEEYEALVETAMDAIVVMDERGRVLSWNPSAERILGYSRAEALGTLLIDLVVDEEFQAFMWHELSAFLETGQSALLGKVTETRGKRKNGQVFAAEFTVSARQTIAGWVGTLVIRDISQRKQIEEQVNELNRVLERRAAELESVNRELESFTYSVSHDLRSPLASILSFSQLVLQDYGAQLPENARRYLEQVEASAIAMSDLIEGLLALSRSARMPLLRQEIVTAELVRQALATLEKDRAGRQIEIVVGELPNCRADPTLLKQVWINLLSNAIKFTRPRAVARIEISSIESSASPPLVTLQTQAAKEPPTARPCTYYVRDNGVGFDMASADYMFGVFHRLHGEDEFEGHGVGLATVERIVQRHGGRVWAEAEVDMGATFYFTLGEA